MSSFLPFHQIYAKKTVKFTSPLFLALGGKNDYNLFVIKRTALSDRTTARQGLACVALFSGFDC